MDRQVGQTKSGARLVGGGKNHPIGSDQHGRNPRQAQAAYAFDHFGKSHIEANHALEDAAGVDRRDTGEHPTLSRRIEINPGPHCFAAGVVLCIGKVEKIEFTHIEFRRINLPRPFDKRVVAVHIRRFVGVEVGGDHMGSGFNRVAVECIEGSAADREAPFFFAHFRHR